MGLYRVVREDGRVEYADVPSGSGQMEAVRPGSTRADDEARRREDAKKYPQFRPLRETALGLKAGSNLLGAGVGLATGKFTGSVEKWMASTLKDLMKRDRFGPYADALPVLMAEDLIKKGRRRQCGRCQGAVRRGPSMMHRTRAASFRSRAMRV
ncbi:hypothetical protein [Methylibium rhizosphaerae]|uniref:hypothetical protein n=1 Tax=Methylibium rhizosphaerae TaxID=2570323 RepID=UPI0011261E10|nr:hypothetical protein [Methylibium rhizosphaerae]